jgi:hypothetical protein
MGYRIVYGKQEKKILPLRKIGAIAAVIAVMAILLWPAGRSAVAQMLLPGDAEITATALQNMAKELGEGQGIGEAVTAFCQEIIAGGQ